MAFVSGTVSAEAPAVSGVGWAAPAADTLTVVQSPHLRMAKLIRADGSIVDYDNAKTFNMRTGKVADLDDLYQLLQRLIARADCFVVRGGVVDPSGSVNGVRRLVHPDLETGDVPTLRPEPHRWLALDVDGIERPAHIPADHLDLCGQIAIAALPAEFHEVRCIVQATAGHGFKPGCRLRLWFWLDRPMDDASLKTWLAGVPVDRSIFSAAQPIYTAAPVFDAGLRDHLPCRLIEIPGRPHVAVPAAVGTAAPCGSAKPPPQPGLLARDPIAFAAIVRELPNDGWADGREMWLTVGRAILASFGHEHWELARDLWFDFCARWHKPSNEGEGERTLNSLRPPHQVGEQWLLKQMQRLGMDVSAYIGEAAREAFKAEPLPPAVITSTAIEAAPFELRVREGWFTKSEQGGLLICAPFLVLGRAEDGSGEGAALVLGFADAARRRRVLLVPMSVVHAGGAALAGMMATAGLHCVGTKAAHDALRHLLSCVDMCPQLPRIRTVTTAGWQHVDDRAVFVLPDGAAVGAAAEWDVLLRQGDAIARDQTGAWTSGGTLADWQRGIARYAVGNDRLVFFLSASFAPPLLQIAREMSGGVHLVGPSSNGKTTVIACAASVWGPSRAQVRQWNATTNGLEALAAGTSDMLLALDELGQASADAVADIVYGLFNESGKATMTRTRRLRAPASWRTVVLSTGEKTVAQKIAEGGRRQEAPAGLDVRLPNIPADAGAGLGVFQTLHGMASAGALAEHLSHAAQTHYGTAGRAYLHRLVTALNNPARAGEITAQIDAVRSRFRAAHLPAEADGQVVRVAARFGLIAAAGELATGFGILPWPAGEAERAAGALFAQWIAARGGTGAAEDMGAVRRVRLFLEQHGSSRFAELRPVTTGPDTGLKADLGAAETDASARETEYAEGGQGRTINRVGWRRLRKDGTVEFLILPESWAVEICAGADPNKVANILLRNGYLEKGDGKNVPKKIRIPEYGRNPVRCYVVNAGILAGSD